MQKGVDLKIGLRDWRAAMLEIHAGRRRLPETKIAHGDLARGLGQPR